MSHRSALLLLLLAGRQGGATIVADAGAPAGDGGAAPLDSGPPALVVQTEDGPVVGRLGPEGVAVFRGIPFAAPPVGDLRFAPPAPVEPWSEPLDATGAGTRCLQRALLTGETVGGEDCLHVNVWTPALEGSRPVMVWIHGGAFESGSGSDDLANAWRIARDGDVVVVTLNYRLGIFGSLAHASLAGEGQPNGNWGVLDQQAALRWARANAAHFGGDPDDVTVFGHSAGGMSTCLMALSPTARGLARRFIDQSGPCVIQLRSLELALDLGERVAGSVGCTGDVASCLRSAGGQELIDALELPQLRGGMLYQEVSLPHRPTLDGVTFVEQPLDALRAGRLAEATYLIGAARDEGTMFHHPLAATPVRTAQEMREALGHLSNLVAVTPEQADAIAAQYPASAYATPNEALTAASTDMFICAIRYVGRLTSAAGQETYLYHFAQEPADVLIDGLGVYHGADLIFLFGEPNLLGGAPTSAPDLGPAMRGYWSRFAATGDPAGAPEWPIWTAFDDRRLRFAERIEVEAGDPDGRCTFWDAILDTL